MKQLTVKDAREILAGDFRSYLKNSLVFTHMPECETSFAYSVNRYLDGTLRFPQLKAAIRHYCNEQAERMTLSKIHPRLEDLQVDVCESYRRLANLPDEVLNKAITGAAYEWEAVAKQAETAAQQTVKEALA